MVFCSNNYLLKPKYLIIELHRMTQLIQVADIQSKVEELNQALRNRDKMKDDAIAQLSDQVMA
jgi:hypothetical protein